MAAASRSRGWGLEHKGAGRLDHVVEGGVGLDRKRLDRLRKHALHNRHRCSVLLDALLRALARVARASDEPRGDARLRLSLLGRRRVGRVVGEPCFRVDLALREHWEQRGVLGIEHDHFVRSRPRFETLGLRATQTRHSAVDPALDCRMLYARE
eukprot:482911-Rhodomonas_salina.1